MKYLAKNLPLLHFLHVHNVAFSQARGGDCYVCVVLINAGINAVSTHPQRKEVLIPFVVLSSSCFGGVCAYNSSQTAWLVISQYCTIRCIIMCLTVFLPNSSPLLYAMTSNDQLTCAVRYYTAALCKEQILD